MQRFGRRFAQTALFNEVIVTILARTESIKLDRLWRLRWLANWWAISLRSIAQIVHNRSDKQHAQNDQIKTGKQFDPVQGEHATDQMPGQCLTVDVEYAQNLHKAQIIRRGQIPETSAKGEQK
ncbi:hypothetical protein T4E_9854 [Trichinella pseudospiralis]|uniref:Uncharacterized protein n=1 Tax=Trichinella pseudospiralis TaxID=6337 RepID=A0A0V0XN44_TRIPS|nr:hypothetical protein T4E_9854 [Trichinella pseudospiralis]